jgi:4'-phosphopantetheinyl transferase N-terminal domain
VRGAVETRLREFTAARTCARLAIAKLGLPAGPILRGAWREPIWPRGVVGSITHCRGYRAAAVAKQRNVLTVGIGAEPDEQLPPGVLEQVAVASEQAWLPVLASIGTACCSARRGAYLRHGFRSRAIGWASNMRLSRFIRRTAPSRSGCRSHGRSFLAMLRNFSPAVFWGGTGFF